MKVFVAASYSTKVDYDNGEVLPEYKEWLESILNTLEGFGHKVFCSLRADQYKINDDDPAEAFNLDVKQITEADALLALLDDQVSPGTQTEIGYALALNKKVILSHDNKHKLKWFNQAIIKSGQASEVTLPFETDPLTYNLDK